jgi:hypothetical protein
MMPALSAWIESTRPGHQDEHHRVSEGDDLDLALPGADRLQEDQILAGRVEHERGLERRLSEPAEVPARPHRADEDVGIEEVVGEPDPVAEERAFRERARGVDGDDADARPARADVPDERADQRRFPDAGRAGDADRVALAGLPVELSNELVRERIRVLDQRDCTRECAAVAVADAGEEAVERPRASHQMSAPRRST